MTILGQLESDTLPSLFVAPEEVEAVRDELARQSALGETDAKEEINSLKMRLPHDRQRLDTLLDLRLNGEITREEYENKKSSIERSIALMVARETELAERIRQRAASVEMVIRVANSLPTLWDQGDDADRRELLDVVFEKLIVGNGRIVQAVLREPFKMLGARNPSHPKALIIPSS